MIPDFEDGVLPEGVHDCTLDELERKLGHPGATDQRDRLTKKLREFVKEARLAGFVVALVVNGSYVTAKDRPDDVDLIVCLRPDFDLAQELRPFEYNVCSRRMVKKLYKFDVFVAPDGSDEYRRLVDFFAQVRKTDPEPYTSRARKGLLRITL